jgi:hypothetical protein
MLGQTDSYIVSPVAPHVAFVICHFRVLLSSLSICKITIAHQMSIIYIAFTCTIREKDDSGSLSMPLETSLLPKQTSASRQKFEYLLGLLALTAVVLQ